MECDFNKSKGKCGWVTSLAIIGIILIIVMIGKVMAAYLPILFLLFGFPSRERRDSQTMWTSKGEGFQKVQCTHYSITLME